MKLAYVDFCGFRGYRKPLRIDFPGGFTIIDGRNGVGKSTIFDAVEFALTGTISKYGDAKADGETVADYIWWSGEGPPPDERYVEIGFSDGDNVLSVRRKQLAGAGLRELEAIRDRLCDPASAPELALPQLCAASIIRDEHITTLSLDLKETDRYSRLRDAIGATNADLWIERSSGLLSIIRKRVSVAEKEVEAAGRDVAAASRRIDEIRSGLAEDSVIAVAAARLQSLVGSNASPDQLVEPARRVIAEKARQLEQFASLEAAWQKAEAARTRLPELKQAVVAANEMKEKAEAAAASISRESQAIIRPGELAQRARDLANLVQLGHKLGLRDGHCPLCASERTSEDFIEGLALAERLAREFDAQAVEEAERERTSKTAIAAVIAAQGELQQKELALQVSQDIVSKFEQLLAAAGLPIVVSIDQLRERQQELRAEVTLAREDLRLLETLKLNAGLEKALHEEVEAKRIYARAEEKLGLARRAESRAQALHDAARRAAGETLNRRLERVLPLMTELYRRLRPHPVWSDIEYKIRGDVRRFLKLQVGDDLNPQFIFSSGQRRATGLAFLLAVNLSLAWSRWQTILLDDPVQHVDDFRSVHLAEVMAHLALSGKQIICAVEDAAMADLLCRRLPVESPGMSKRVTLGPDSEGALTKLGEQDLIPLPQRALVTGLHRLAG